MNIKTNNDIINDQIKESLLHGLLDWITFLFTTREIIVVPSLERIICNNDKDKFVECKNIFIDNEPLIVERYGKKYEIYNDFPDFLELTKEDILQKKPLYFSYSFGEYFDRPHSNGTIAIYKFKKPPKRKTSKNNKLLK